MFKRLTISNWRQYGEVDISFHPKLTIITGANGAGKTTLLNILNQHIGGLFSPLVGVPIISLSGLIYSAGLSDLVSRILVNSSNAMQLGGYGQSVSIGSIEYANGVESQIAVPENPGSTYNFIIVNQQQIKGIAINSIRPLFKYEPVATISTGLQDKNQYYHNYKSSSSNRFHGGSNNGRGETYYIKETLISWATYGPGNSIIAPNPQALSLFNGFKNILTIVLPSTLGFTELKVRPPEVVLITDTGEFPVDAVSGGVASIIDLAWQIYMYDNGGFPFVVTIDEPENHLHPEIQKNLLPNMMQAFPNCQFIVATHSPFIISSIADSNAYALKYDEYHKVYSVILDRVNKAGTANEILREVLGLEDTMPNWVDDKIDAIISRYKDSGLNKANVSLFKQELDAAGLGKYIPTSLIKLIETHKAEESDL